jgi:NAD(P)-dependent dehydrogenase (short-subunit alcohol dehydrogenase family)
MTPRILPKILIVGGYGAFGARAAERLARSGGHALIIAGRNGVLGQAFAAELAAKHGGVVTATTLDATTVTPEALKALGAAVVINASGPFQAQDYSLARAAIAAGMHYLDLADARAFVAGIASLDREAKAAGVLVLSGASTVPAVATAVVDHLSLKFARHDRLSYGLSPGNAYDPGPATTASILGGLGQPFTSLTDGTMQTIHGWDDCHRHTFPVLGRRWMARCDVPDLDTMPARFPTLREVRFYAGVEIGVFHLSLAALAKLRRWRLLPDLTPLTRPLLWAKRRLGFLGTDDGGMFVTLDGIGPDGQAKRVDWHLIARRNHGPYIPTLAAVVLARKLAGGELLASGAGACVGYVTLDDLLAEVADLDIKPQMVEA